MRSVVSSIFRFDDCTKLRKFPRRLPSALKQLHASPQEKEFGNVNASVTFKAQTNAKMNSALILSIGLQISERLGLLRKKKKLNNLFLNNFFLKVFLQLLFGLRSFRY